MKIQRGPRLPDPQLFVEVESAAEFTGVVRKRNVVQVRAFEGVNIWIELC